MERDVFADIRLDWPEIVGAAKRRRQELKLTQRRLAAVAGVSLPTVVKLEKGEDIRLSSAQAILKVLDLVAAPVDGNLLLQAGQSAEAGPFTVTFAPYWGPGGGLLAPRKLDDREALDEFLITLRISEGQRQRAYASLKPSPAPPAIIPNVQLHRAELRRYWPTQFAARA